MDFSRRIRLHVILLIIMHYGIYLYTGLYRLDTFHWLRMIEILYLYTFRHLFIIEKLSILQTV